MTDRKLSIEDIAAPAKERVEFLMHGFEQHGIVVSSSHIETALRYSDLWTSQHPIVPSEEESLTMARIRCELAKTHSVYGISDNFAAAAPHDPSITSIPVPTNVAFW